MIMKAVHLLGLFIIVQQCILLALSVPVAQHRRRRQQLPCTHPLRLSAPELFTHCSSTPGCTYGSWSSWERVSGNETSVPQSQCESGKAYTEQRTRPTTGSGCNQPVRETRRICLPSREELVILALGLGGSGNNYDPIDRSGSDHDIGSDGHLGIFACIGCGSLVLDNRRCPHNGRNGQICSHIPGIGKRSAELDEEAFESDVTLNKHDLTNEVKLFIEDNKSDMSNPIPFDWFEHGPRFRQRRQAQCNNRVQNVLFVLDTSGSIGSDQFNKVKIAVANLTTLFCKQVQFALVTFGSNVNLEFCFDCFQNTYSGRQDAHSAIRSAPYRGGRTHTAGTARCICEDLIHSSCGIDPTLSPACLDVVFITDGKSNDRTLDVCQEIRCLHNRYGVNTYAIGINSGNGFQPTYNQAELECIDHYSDAISAFNYESFNDFEDSIRSITRRLVNALPNSPESCYARDGSLSPTGAPPFAGRR